MTVMTFDDNLQVPPPLPEPLAQLITKYNNITDGMLNTQTLALLNVHQMTLFAYDIVRREVMQGGFIQLIYNGYGDFIFRNPFAKMMRCWGIDALTSLINKAKKLEQKYRHDILQAETDEEFMALYEQMPQFDDCDDTFVEKENDFTMAIVEYVNNNSSQF